MKMTDEELEEKYGHYAEQFENFPPQIANQASSDLARATRARYRTPDPNVGGRD